MTHIGLSNIYGGIVAMESMFIKLNQKCPAANLPIKDILRFRLGLRSSDFAVKTGQIMIIYNPTYIDADTIIEAFLQKGYAIDYYWNVA